MPRAAVVISPADERLRLERQSLEALVSEGVTLREMAERQGLSLSGIKVRMRRHGLSTARSWNNRDFAKLQYSKRLVGDLGSRPILECTIHGEGVFYEEPTRYRCQACNTQARTKRNRKLKAKAIALLGGKCMRCDYDRCDAALEFHHRDPASKSFNISEATSMGEAAVLSEVTKCDLLCANCHREVEYDLHPEAA